MDERRTEAAAVAAPGLTRRPIGPASASHLPRYNQRMCRNIRPLFNFDPPATDDDIHSAATQFVRKLSGFDKPSQANAAAFDRAVDEIAAAARELIDSLVTTSTPRDRAAWAARAKERSAQRFARPLS